MQGVEGFLPSSFLSCPEGHWQSRAETQAQAALCQQLRPQQAPQVVQLGGQLQPATTTGHQQQRSGQQLSIVELSGGSLPTTLDNWQQIDQHQSAGSRRRSTTTTTTGTTDNLRWTALLQQRALHDSTSSRFFRTGSQKGPSLSESKAPDASVQTSTGWSSSVPSGVSSASQTQNPSASAWVLLEAWKDISSS